MEADLREGYQPGKCELEFDLKFEYKGMAVKENIIAVRQRTENILSLQAHIINKIKYYVKRKCAEACLDMEEPTIAISFKEKNKEMPTSTPLVSLLLHSNKKYTMYINKEKYVICVNRPHIKKLTLPMEIYVDTPITYTTIKYLKMSIKNSFFTWFVCKDNIWKERGKGLYFCARKEDVGCNVKLRVIPVSERSLKGKATEVCSQNTVAYMCDISLENFTERHQMTRESLSGNELRIVNYNILAEMYATKDNFPYCDSSYLSVDYRKKFAWLEIAGYNSDIICLQEVGVTVFKNYLKKNLLSERYECVFDRKGNRSREGLMIAFRKSRFQLITHKHVVISEYVSKDPVLSKIVACENFKDTFFKLPTSMQYCILQWKDKNMQILVANTHLYYEQDAGLIRLLQAIVIMEELKKYTQTTILCGDFNSLPGTSSHKYLLDGEVENSDAVQDERYKAFSHNFNFDSAYGCPEFTNYVANFKGCLDYIFYQKDKFRVLETLPIPTEEKLSANVALPSKMFPSDHISLICDLVLT